ncbi:MAG: hypothetical protein M3N13_09980, partial [Candidatus Eremiobacteraeota bacterium]|nr:hypothetical protein [Candidatus Eremiobacteraeota bacterium]
AQAFSKHVLPDTSCPSVNNGCVYIDSIAQILLEPAYGFQPPVPAIDSDHELLFKILKIVGVIDQCRPYSYFDSVPGGDPIQWGGSGIGAPTDAVNGFGQPSIYSTINHLSVGTTSLGSFIEVAKVWSA